MCTVERSFGDYNGETFAADFRLSLTTVDVNLERRLGDTAVEHLFAAPEGGVIDRRRQLVVRKSNPRR